MFIPTDSEKRRNCQICHGSALVDVLDRNGNIIGQKQCQHTKTNHAPEKEKRGAAQLCREPSKIENEIREALEKVKKFATDFGVEIDD